MWHDLTCMQGRAITVADKFNGSKPTGWCAAVPLYPLAALNMLKV